VIPQFSTDYKAAQVYEYHELVNRIPMTADGFIASLFQLFSISTSLDDLRIYKSVQSEADVHETRCKFLKGWVK